MHEIAIKITINDEMIEKEHVDYVHPYVPYDSVR